MHHLPKSLVLLAAALTSATAVGSACHRSKPSDRVTAADSTAATGVLLEVENHNWSDVDIYVVHDGITDRLATITAAKEASIPIPVRLQGETGVFRLIVRRIGGTDSYRSEPISVRTGNTVRLTVESTLARSSVGVW